MENTLYYRDNLEILREYIPDESVDLIYLDPPFKSKSSLKILVIVYFLFITPFLFSSNSTGDDFFQISGIYEHFSKFNSDYREDYLPFHGANYLKLNLTKNIIDDLNFNFTLFSFNESICAPYYESSSIIFRYNFEYKYSFDKLFKTKFIFGDLGRFTYGKGLIIDQFEQDAIYFELADILFSNISLKYIFLPVGMIENSDSHLLSISPFKNLININSMLTFFETEIKDEDDKKIFEEVNEYQLFTSIDFKIPLYKNIFLYGEIGAIRNVCREYKNIGYAYLFGFNYNYSSKLYKINVGIEVREYETNFNDFFRDNVEEIYHGMDAYNKKFNNWRNYILYDGGQKGYCLNIDFMRKIGKISNKFEIEFDYLLNLEFIRINYDNYLFYTIGGKAKFWENLILNLAFSNKSMPNQETPYLKDDQFMFIQFPHYLANIKIVF